MHKIKVLRLLEVWNQTLIKLTFFIQHTMDFYKCHLLTWLSRDLIF